MMRAMKNMGAAKLALNGRKKSGPLGALLRLSIADRLLGRGRGVSGKLARVGITTAKAKVGLGILAGIVAVIGGVVGMRGRRTPSADASSGS